MTTSVTQSNNTISVAASGVMTPKVQQSLEHFIHLKAEHQRQVDSVKELSDSIERARSQQKDALDKSQEADGQWRTLFRKLRGEVNDELQQQHIQRISQRELAHEYDGLLEELSIEKEFTTLNCCESGKKLMESHERAFIDYAEQELKEALSTINFVLIRAIKLKRRALELSESKESVYAHIEKYMMIMEAAYTFDMDKEPTLRNIGIQRPSMAGFDSKLMDSPMSRQLARKALNERKNKLQGSPEQ